MKKEYTKMIIAHNFKELSKEKPIARITIKDIVTRCGFNHSTFYYHFSDKDHLIEWIIKKDIEAHFHKADVEVWTHNIYHLLCVFKNDYEFYQQCLKLNTQNNLRKLIYDINCRAITDYIDIQLADRALCSYARSFLISFWSSAFTETNINYILDGAPVSPEKMLQYYYISSEPVLMNVIDKLIETESDEGMLPVTRW